MTQFKNFISPHVHVKSLDSASTPEKFAKRELELGTGYVTVTDHGTLEATRAVYDLLTEKEKFKGKLKPILGLEGYFRDDQCPEFMAAGKPRDKEGLFKEYMKYMHLTLHAMDEKAFYTLCRILSRADDRAEQHGSERKPLFSWENLEELGAQNMTITSGCLIGMVSRHLLQHNDPRMAIRYYERLRSVIKPGNFYVEIFPHVCDRNWESAVFVTYEDGTTEKFMTWKGLKTKKTDARGIKAENLAESYKRSPAMVIKDHDSIVAVMENRKWVDREPKKLKSIEHREGNIQNECRPWAPNGDVQLGTNKFLLKLAHKYGDPVLISDDSHFAYPEEKVVQDIRLAQMGNWRFPNSHHRMTSAEAWEYFRIQMGASEGQFEGWVENGYNWASRFNDFKFTPRKSLPTRFYPQDTLRHTMELVKRHGRWNMKDPVQMERMKAEINLLHKNGTIDLLPYFFVLEEVCNLYARNGELTGPGRGSAAGVQLAYDLGITHADPVRYKLSLDRFLTLDRVQTGKLPDIDQDLPHRDLLVDPQDPQKGWLKDRFGDCYAQLSTDTTMKIKSAIKDVFRARHGEVSDEIEALCKTLPNPPQGINDHDYVFGFKSSEGWTPGLLEISPTLQAFVKRYPTEWEVVQQVLGLPRQKGRHACAFVISDDPISSFIPTMTVGGVRVTQFTAAAVEASGGLKMDFLRVNSIKDIGDALKLIQDRHGTDIDWKPSRLTDADLPGQEDREVVGMVIDGKKVDHIRCVPINGRYYDIWDLPEDAKVFHDICTGKVETVFQLDAGAARQGLQHFAPYDGKLPIKSIEDLAAFTALDRPGPLDARVKDEHGNEHNMLVEFAHRAAGKERIGAVPVLDKLIPETYGVIVYQEQLQNIFQQIGQTTAIEANNFRQDISKKKMDKVIKHGEKFMKGATKALGDAAAPLWASMETFGQYGFNKSHAVCYMIVSYACAWLKHHYPLEWWTAVLKNAERKEIDEKFWRHCGHLIDLPDIQMSGKNFEVKNERIRAPLWLLHGLGEKAHGQLMLGAPYSNIEDLLTKIEKWREENGTKVEKLNKKTGNNEWVLKKATTALNDTVLRNLVISGAMDSLFPDRDAADLPMMVPDRIAIYEEVASRVRGKKTRKGTATQYNLQSKMVQYQVRKKILPAYSEDMIPVVSESHRDFLVKPARVDHWSFLQTGDDDKLRYFRVLTGKEIDESYGIENAAGKDVKVCLLGYVVQDRRFSYKKKDTGENKTASEVGLDVDGVRINVVRWPGKNGLPDSFKENLEGAVVACLFTRSDTTSTFFLADVVVLSPSLKKREESEENNERSPEEAQ